MHDSLTSAQQQVSASTAALADRIAATQARVSTLQECIVAASEELRRPRATTSVAEVVQLGQRLGYVVAAPSGWMVRARSPAFSLASGHYPRAAALIIRSPFPVTGESQWL